MPKTFIIQAGKSALHHIKKNGLSPNDITSIPAAAGGPKWISLFAFDKYLIREWFQDRTTPLYLFGASAGAWRMLCYAMPDPLDAIDRFLKAYVEQSYPSFPTPSEVSRKVEEIVQHILEDHSPDIFSIENVMQLHVISSMTHFDKKKQSKYRRHFLRIALKNSISRKLLSSELERIVFTNSASQNIIQDRFKTTYIPFDKNNVIPALRSTGTIPMLMEPVENINGLQGMLWDGALIDYHIGLDYKPEGLILYPHFSKRIIEGWFDKFAPWRKFKSKVTNRLIIISPSDAFVRSMPDAKIPDRKDFKTYFENNDQRIQNWYKVAKMGDEMAAEFDYYWKNNKLHEIIQPI